MKKLFIFGIGVLTGLLLSTVAKRIERMKLKKQHNIEEFQKQYPHLANYVHEKKV